MSTDGSLSVPSKWKKCKENNQSGYFSEVVFASEDKQKSPLALFYSRHLQPECNLVCCRHCCYVFRLGHKFNNFKIIHI